jgi:hypothetical protein
LVGLVVVPDFLLVSAMKNWKTTAAGFAQFTAIIFREVGYVLDSDPATNLDFNLLFTSAAILWGLWSSRDWNVSSEQSM